MRKFAFITRHAVSAEQEQIARDMGVELVSVGDRDAFTITAEEIWAIDPEFVGAVVVHPAAAMRLARYMKIGVWENASRAVEGGRPSFKAVALHIY